MPRPKNFASVPRRSSFSFNSPGYMHLKDFENSPSSFIIQRSSMNRLVACYLYALVGFFGKKILNMLRLKKNRETDLLRKQAQYP